MEQNYDYNKLLKEFEKHDGIVTNFYLSNKKVSVNDETKIPRKRFTEERKQDIREHYLLTDNFAKTAKSFCLNGSPVTKIVKSTLRNDVKPSDKGIVLGLVDLLHIRKKQKMNLLHGYFSY